MAWAKSMEISIAHPQPEGLPDSSRRHDSDPRQSQGRTSHPQHENKRATGP